MRTYVFGAREPSQNLDLVTTQLALATRYRNVLTEVGRLAQQANMACVIFKEEKSPDVREEVNRLIRERRAACGVFWGTYLQVEAAFEQALSTSKSDLRFTRHDGSGRVSCQLPSTAPLTVEALLAGTDTRARITGTGKHREFHIRVGSDASRKPIFATAPFSYHRDLPAGARVIWVHLQAKRIATKLKWFVHIVCKGEETARPLPAGDGVIAIDVGWRLKPDGSVRVAAMVMGGGVQEELALPAYLRERDQKVEDLRSIRDKNFNEARAALASWLKRTCLGCMMASDVGVTVKGDPVAYAHPECPLHGDRALPDWLTHDTATLTHWRSPAKLAALAVKWRHQRFEGDDEVFAALEAWRKQDKHLYEWEGNQRQRILRQRLEIYRLAAVRIARFRRVVVEKLDLRDFAEKPQARADAPDDERPREAPALTASRGRRFDAGLSILLGCIKQAVARAGGEFVEVAPQWTTQTCVVCGEREEFDAVELLHTCSHCGARWDQDFNAAANLLKLAERVEAFHEVVDRVRADALSAVAKRRLDGKAKKKAAKASEVAE